jgi:autotransporter-associated beta strand protein
MALLCRRTRISTAAFSALLVVPAYQAARAVTVNVAAGDSTGLKNAMSSAVPGETIVLQGGTYNTGISTSVNGTAAAPITVEGLNGATLSNTTGTGEGIEVNNNYWVFQNLNISGFQESFRTYGANHGIANNITCTGSKIESFKFKNTSTHWLVENCSVFNAGMEGYYVGDANQNWTGGVPDASGFITFYHDTNFSDFNDGFDCKEGANNVRIIDCRSDWNNTVPGGNNEGDSGAYIRDDFETVVNYTVLNNQSQGNAARVQTSTVNGITYGSNTSLYGLVANNIAGSFLDTTQNGTVLYSNYSLTNVGGGLLESGSKTPSQPNPSTFALPTWAGVDGQFLPITVTWDNSQSAVGNGTTWDFVQQNFDDIGVNGSIPAIFFQGVGVTFSDANNGHYAVTLTSTVNPSSVAINNSSGSYVIGGSGSIAGTAAVTKTGSGVATLNTVNTYTGGTNVSAGMLVAGVHGAIPDGSVNITGGTLRLAPSTGGTTITSLAISGSGTLDINNNHLIINYAAPANDPISSITALLKTGYNGGAWNGLGGIDSSAVAGNPGYTIGYADAADVGNPAGLASGTMEIAFTLIGDADLNHTVNGIDFGILAANFNKTVSRWDQGDFDYNNIVNGIDFTALAANFNKAANNASDIAALDAFAAANGLLADVPEPASFVMLAIGAGALLKRKPRIRIRGS